MRQGGASAVPLQPAVLFDSSSVAGTGCVNGPDPGHEFDVIVADVVFVATSPPPFSSDRANLYALSVQDGHCLWSAGGLAVASFSLGPAVYRNYVVVGAGNRVYIYRLGPNWLFPLLREQADFGPWEPWPPGPPPGPVLPVPDPPPLRLQNWRENAMGAGARPWDHPRAGFAAGVRGVRAPKSARPGALGLARSVRCVRWPGPMGRMAALGLAVGPRLQG
jgi:hypothetical protein